MVKNIFCCLKQNQAKCQFGKKYMFISFLFFQTRKSSNHLVSVCEEGGANQVCGFGGFVLGFFPPSRPHE